MYTWLSCEFNFIRDQILTLRMLGKGFDSLCKLSPREAICVKSRSLIPRKNKKNILALSSAEFAIAC